jgi:endonuclease/exonuclease/phosphatase family metal-dependent hydrolase
MIRPSNTFSTVGSSVKRFFVTLAALLNALISGASPGAALPQQGNVFKLATWNIQVGSDRGNFQNGWPQRKEALIPALKELKADILCTQEGRLEQLQWIDSHFPKYSRTGVGRDDGRNGGEFCAIYYLSERFELLKSGTFWLSDTPDTADSTWDGPYKRICTHALFRDKKSGSQFAVLSTHFPLIAEVQPKAARLIAERITKYYAGIPTFLCGDFNCRPDSEPWKVFAADNLQPSDTKHAKTYLDNGTPTDCLDSIFKSSDISVVDCKLIDVKYNGRYPSDHFGLCVKAVVPRAGGEK